RTEDGRKRLHTLGPYGALTLHQARDLAAQILLEARTGKDPQGERQQARRERETAVTVSDFAAKYVAEARTRGQPRTGRPRRPKKTWAEDQRRLNKYVVPAIGRKRLDEVTEDDIRRIHGGIEGIYEANRVLALLSVFFESARMLGHLPKS